MERKICKTEQWAYDRSSYMHEHAEELGIYFDPIPGRKIINLAERYLVHWKGKLAKHPDTRNIVLAPFQKFILQEELGWKRKSDNTRLFRESFKLIPKKNAKSFLTALECLYFALFDNEYGGELYCAAPKRDQTKHVFETCQEFLRKAKHKDIRKQVDVKEHWIKIKQFKSIIRCLSACKNIDGMNASFAACDEIQDFDEDIYNSITTSMVQRESPFISCIGTAGDDLLGFGYSKYDYAKKVLNPDLPDFQDWSLFVFILEPDSDWSWEDENTWLSVNPLLGTAMSIEDFKNYYQKAKQDRTFFPKFLKYHCNIWTEQTAQTWLDYEKWTACKRNYTPEYLFGCPVWLGIDLSKTTDLSSIALIAEKDGQLHTLSWVYLPQETIDKVDKSEAPYKQWVEDGYIEPCGSFSIDPSMLFDRIQWIAENFKIQDIGFDRNCASELIGKCELEGLPITLVNQGLYAFSAPSKRLEELIGNQHIFHNDSPCLNWQIRNAQIQIKGDCIKPVKDYAASSKRIDTVISLIMALYCKMQPKEPEAKDNSDFYAGWAKAPSNLRNLLGI